MVGDGRTRSTSLVVYTTALALLDVTVVKLNLAVAVAVLLIAPADGGRSPLTGK